MTQPTPEQIDRILAANTARCAPEAARQIAEGHLAAKTWEQTVRMTRELVHTIMRYSEDERRPRTLRQLRERPQIVLRVGDDVGTLYAGRNLGLLVSGVRLLPVTLDTPCEVLP